MRKTGSLVQVALVLLNAPTARHWGYALSKQTGVAGGVLRPMLTRMLEEGWLEDGWEDPTAAARGKHAPRRYYRLTANGQEALNTLIQEVRSEGRFPWLKEESM